MKKININLNLEKFARFMFLALGLSLILASPAQALSDFYDSSEIQFYEDCGGSTGGSTPSSSSGGGATTSITISGPFKPKATPGDHIKKGDAYKGQASTYGNDPKTGYVDPGDVDSSGNPLKPALSGRQTPSLL